MSTVMSLLLYFTLAVGSADIDINLSDSGVVYKTTDSLRHRLNMVIIHVNSNVTTAIFYSSKSR